MKPLKISIFACCMALSLNFAMAQTEAKPLQGRVVCGSDSIDFAFVYNTRTKQVVQTNNGGRFNIMVQPNDTLCFRSLGYNHESYIVPVDNVEMAVLQVHRVAYSLSEVQVKSFYSYASFKHAFANLKLDNKDQPMKFAVKIDYARMEVDSKLAPGEPGFGLDLTKLVLKGAAMLQSKEKVAELQRQDVRNERYNTLISHENIGEFTHLKDKALDDFIIYLRKQVNINPAWSDYQIMASVKLAFANYTSESKTDTTTVQ